MQNIYLVYIKFEHIVHTKIKMFLISISQRQYQKGIYFD